MAIRQRYPNYTSVVDGAERNVEFGPGTCLPDEIMPAALPDIWDVIADGTSIAPGTHVFSSDELYLCVTRHNKSNLRPESDLNNWIRPGRPLVRLTNEAGGSTSTNNVGINGLRFRFNVSETTTTGTTVDDTNGLGTVTYNLNTSGLGGGGGVSSGGSGLDVDGTRVDFDYNDPTTLVRLLTEATVKAPRFGADGLPTTNSVELPHPSGTGIVDYFIEYTFTNGLPSRIEYYEGTDNTGTLRAVKTLTFSNGLPSLVTIGAS